MPARIRTDNGAPFAGTGLLGLSKLSLSWTKMGIVHERIQPCRPQQNGRHERMHRTLKEDTTKPPALTLRLQEKKFDRFRQIFNHERPHEGLNNETPASCISAAQSCFQEYSRRSLTQEAFRPEGSTLVAISAGTKAVCSSARSSPSKISASRRWMRRFSGFTFERSNSASWT
jgi:hypothetical protein